MSCNLSFYKNDLTKKYSKFTINPKYIVFQAKNNQLYTGKIGSSDSKGEVYHWAKLHHRSIAPLMQIININSDFNIYLSIYLKQTLRDLVHQYEFICNPDCFNWKKLYVEDILWGLEYLHRKSLCLFNVNDENIFICIPENKAVITDFSNLSIAERDVKYFFNIPFFSKAPELIEGRSIVNPILTESWSVGVLVLNVFLSHNVPWALVNFDPRRALEILVKMDDRILKSANSGSILNGTDISKFKMFVSAFFLRNPQDRITCKAAASSKFIHEARKFISARYYNTLLSEKGNSYLLANTKLQKLNELAEKYECCKINETNISIKNILPNKNTLTNNFDFSIPFETETAETQTKNIALANEDKNSQIALIKPIKSHVVNGSEVNLDLINPLNTFQFDTRISLSQCYNMDANINEIHAIADEKNCKLSSNKSSSTPRVQPIAPPVKPIAPTVKPIAPTVKPVAHSNRLEYFLEDESFTECSVSDSMDKETAISFSAKQDQAIKPNLELNDTQPKINSLQKSISNKWLSETYFLKQNEVLEEFQDGIGKSKETSYSGENRYNYSELFKFKENDVQTGFPEKIYSITRKPLNQSYTLLENKSGGELSSGKFQQDFSNEVEHTLDKLTKQNFQFDYKINGNESSLHKSVNSKAVEETQWCSSMSYGNILEPQRISSWFSQKSFNKNEKHEKVPAAHVQKSKNYSYEKAIAQNNDLLGYPLKEADRYPLIKGNNTRLSCPCLECKWQRIKVRCETNNKEDELKKCCQLTNKQKCEIARTILQNKDNSKSSQLSSDLDCSPVCVFKECSFIVTKNVKKAGQCSKNSRESTKNCFCF